MKANETTNMMELNEEQLEAVTGGDFFTNLRLYRVWESMLMAVFGDMLEEYDKSFE